MFQRVSVLVRQLLHYGIGVVLADKTACFDEEFSVVTYEGLPGVLENNSIQF